MNARQQPFALKTIFTATLACYAPFAMANPTGGTVASGSASFQQQGNSLVVTNTPGSIINWQAFSIGQGEVTRFVQQNSTSAVLNRVTGQDPSQILGQLQSNGRVFLINPNGIVFGQGAQIDTAGLVAGTLNISDADFKAGHLSFQGGTTGSIQNAANITTPSGGFVYLIAPNIQNSGVIVSPKGEILLAGGSSVELVDGVDTALRVKLTAPAGQVTNVGQLIADQGRIGIFAAAIQQQGLVSANSAQLGANGEVVLKASNSTTLAANSTTQSNGGSVLIDTAAGDTVISGTVDVSNDAGTGGTAVLTGQRVGLFGSADINATGRNGGGTVLVGGDLHGKNPDVHNSQETVVGLGAHIDASATQSGNGGKVIVWSDGLTRTFGQVAVEGGAASGDGGFVEMSGKQSLDWHSAVDTKAPSGKSGTLLLDPTNINVVAGSQIGSVLCGSSPCTLDQLDFFTAPDTNSTSQVTLVGATDIANFAGSVQLQATNSINFQTSVNAYPAAALEADTQTGDIVVSGGVTITAANISFNTGYSGAKTGNIIVGGALVATSGQIDLHSANQLQVSGSLTASNNNIYTTSGGDTVISGSLTACTQAQLQSGGAMTLSGAITSTSDLQFSSAGNLAQTGGSIMAPTVQMDSGASGVGTISQSGGAIIKALTFDLQGNGSGQQVGSAGSPILFSSFTPGIQANVAIGGVPLSDMGNPGALASPGSVSAAYIGYTGTTEAVGVGENGVVGTLVFTSPGTINLNNVLGGNATITSTGGSVNLTGYTTNANNLTVNAAQQVVMGTSASISSTLSLQGGSAIMINSPTTINASVVSMASPAITISSGQNSITANSLAFSTDSLTFSGGPAPTATAAALQLTPYTSGSAVDLSNTIASNISGFSTLNMSGGAVTIDGPVSVAGQIAVAATGGFTAGGALEAGSVAVTSGGNISLSGVAAGSINLNAAGSIQTTGALNAPSLGLTTGSAIGSASTPFTTTATNLSLDSTGGGVYVTMAGGTANLAAAGPIQFTGSGSSTVTANSTGGAVTASTSAGNLTVGGASGTSLNFSTPGVLSFTGLASAGTGAVTAQGASVGGGGALAGSTVTITSGGAVGSAAQVLGVNATGNATISAAGAGNGIYVSDAGSVASVNLTAQNAPVSFTSGGDLTLGAISNGNGAVSLIAGGALNIPAGTGLNASSLTLGTGSGFNLANSLTASGSLTLTTTSTINTAPGAVISAPSLTLTAAQGIGTNGSAAAVNTGNLNASSSGSAGVNINSVGTGLLSATVSAGTGNVSLQTAGDLTGSITGNQLTLNVGGAGGTSAQALGLNGNTVSYTGQGLLNAADAGALTISGSTATGDINLSTGGTLTLAGLHSGGNLTANSTGDIVGSGTGDQAVANLASFSAGGKIGTLNSRFQQLTANAGGDLNLINATPLVVNTVNSGGNVVIDSTGGFVSKGKIVAAGSISLTTHSPMTIGTGGLQAGTGISLKSGTGTGNDDLTINGAVLTAIGDCSVVAGGTVHQNANITDGGTGKIAVSSATGDIIMAPGTSSVTNGGSIGYNALGGMTLSLLDAGTGGVTLAATNGNIVSATPGQVNVHGGSLNVAAGGGISLGANVPAGQLTLSSGTGYALVVGPDGTPYPGSITTGSLSGGGSTGGGGSSGGGGSNTGTPPAGVNQTVDAITTTTTTVANGTAGSTQDTTQQQLNKQSGGSQTGGTGGTTGSDTGNQDDKQKKPKKC
ncbi:MAG: filamentous hemagglutinin N-terminal domain-containing protein [Burkholderiales bacterium]|nr:filamentous hemagglutinin N-terminal domain-containing protein [Burkholderiales bacterium]